MAGASVSLVDSTIGSPDSGTASTADSVGASGAGGGGGAGAIPFPFFDFSGLAFSCFFLVKPFSAFLLDAFSSFLLSAFSFFVLLDDGSAFGLLGGFSTLSSLIVTFLTTLLLCDWFPLALPVGTSGAGGGISSAVASAVITSEVDGSVGGASGTASGSTTGSFRTLSTGSVATVSVGGSTGGAGGLSVLVHGSSTLLQ